MPIKEYITFPPGALGPDPLRIPVLRDGPEWFAVSKPAGLGATPHAMYGKSTTLLEALEQAIKEEKRQLVDRGIHAISRVHLLEPELTGAVVFAKSDDSGAKLREALGSQQIEFVFDLIVDRADSLAPRNCDLPVAFSRARMESFISHQHGKKCTTRFIPVAQYGRYSHWEARTTESRAMQLRLHAAESGLRIVGERLFGRVPPIFLSTIKRRYRKGSKPERPLHGPVGGHLREIHLTMDPPNPEVVSCPHPKSFLVTLELLEKHLGRTPLDS